VARRGLTGVLLVGGASSRFGSPKALARMGEETLAERAWRILGEACGERIAVGKVEDRLELPFSVLDDGTEVRAPIAGVVAGLRVSETDVSVVLPVDTPLVTAGLLLRLADACAGMDAAVPQSGPLPGAYAKSSLAVLERRLAEGELSLRAALDDLDSHVIETNPDLLVNVNTPGDLNDLH
jgi:molybdenum cofactor guanylyltransferase